MPPTSVSILVAADRDGSAAQRSLLAIVETADPGLGYEVIVANATDSPRFKQFLEQVEGAIKVIDADPGITRSELLNTAADAAGSEYLVILDARVMPRSGWLQTLLDVAREHRARLGIAGCIVTDSSDAVVEAGYLFDDGGAVSVAGLVESSRNAWLQGFREVPAAGFFGCILPASLRQNLGWMESTSSFSDAWANYCLEIGKSGRAVGIACGSTLSPPPYGLKLQRLEIRGSKAESQSAVELTRGIIESMQAASQMTRTGERIVLSQSTGNLSAYECCWDAYAAIAPLMMGRRVIDLRCRHGYGSHLLADRAESVLGIEERPENVLLARALWGDKNLRFKLGDASDIPRLSDEGDRVVVVADSNDIPGLGATLATMSAGMSDLQDAVVAIVDAPDSETAGRGSGTRELYAGFLRGFFRLVEPLEGDFQDGRAVSLQDGASHAAQLRAFSCRSPRPSEAGLTSIVIPAFDRVDSTMICLEAVRAHTNSHYELVVVNNGSTDGTAEYLARQGDVRVITNRTNQGFSTAVNQGMREALGERILILTNDTLVPPGWLNRMIDQMERTGSSSVGPCSNYAIVAQTVADVPYEDSDIQGILAFADKIARENRGQYTPTPVLSGLCILMKRSVVQRIGGFDPIFNPGYWEDVDFGLRAYASGIQSVIARDVFIHHYRSPGAGWNELMQANWEEFRQKWGIIGVDAASQNWVDEAQTVAFASIVRNREWRFCYNDSIWERPSAEVDG